MASTFVTILVHYVFSTKGRRKFITADLQAKLFPYLGGIARENDMTALSVGGTEDHVHLLLSLPATVTVAKAAQLIKGGSSKWLREAFPECRDFAWQEGYGAFTIGIAQVERTVAYIRGQAEHHKVVTYAEELRRFLATHGIDYDPRHIFG